MFVIFSYLTNSNHDMLLEKCSVGTHVKYDKEQGTGVHKVVKNVVLVILNVCVSLTGPWDAHAPGATVFGLLVSVFLDKVCVDRSAG